MAVWFRRYGVAWRDAIALARRLGILLPFCLVPLDTSVQKPWMGTAFRRCGGVFSCSDGARIATRRTRGMSSATILPYTLLFSPQSLHPHFPPIPLATNTNPNNTGTSTRGPTVDANACSLSCPNTATATAIASSKLLLAAVKLCVAANLYPNPSFRATSSVAKNVIAKYTISGAATRSTATI